MTKKEFNALSEEEKQSWLEIDRDTMERWETEEDIINLPYPENLVRSTYGKRCVIKQPLDGVIDVLVDSLPDYCKRYIDVIFKNHGSVESLADEFGILNSTVVNYVYKARRLLRDSTRAKKLKDYVEIVPDDEF